MKKKKTQQKKKRTNKKTVGDWKVYILLTEKDQLYTGITNNIERRLATHKKGKGALFTKFFGVKKLLYVEDQPTRSAALIREHEIKTWERSRKLKLIETRAQKGDMHASCNH